MERKRDRGSQGVEWGETVDLTTLKGIAKARWWVLAAAVIVSVVVSGRLTEYRNDNLPRFEAVTWITYLEDPQELERDDFETFLETQFALAQDVNSDVLDDTPGPFIPWLLAEVDLESDQNQIQFIGRGYTQEEADQLAVAMRERFLAASTIGAGQQRMAAELDELTVQIADLRAKIAAERERLAAAARVGPPTAEERANEALRAALQTRIEALRSQYATLGVELVNPTWRKPSTIQKEMDRVFEELMRLEAEVAAIPVPDTTVPTPLPDEELLLDELTLQQLEARWQQLYLGIRELDALATVGPLTPDEVSLDPASVRNNQVLAGIGALVAAMVGLVALERGRGIMWSEAAIEEGPPVLVELPARPLRPWRRPTTEAWYLATPGGRRKASVQMLRSQLDYESSSVLAFQGSGVLTEDLRELAVDVGVSAAVSGRAVLVIDTAFHKPNRMVEFGPPGAAPELAELLQWDIEDREEAIAKLKVALLERPELVKGLRGLRAGQLRGDAADALAGPQFELLLEVARDVFDLVVVAGGSVTAPSSHVLAQRVDSVILVGSAGHTLVRSVEATEREFAVRRTSLLGMVLLRRRHSQPGRAVASLVQKGIGWMRALTVRAWRAARARWRSFRS